MGITYESGVLGEFLTVPWTPSVDWSSSSAITSIKDFQIVQQAICEISEFRILFYLNPIAVAILKRIARRAPRKARMRMLNRRKS